MALEPITRKEQIIAGKELEPITRMEKFLKEYGGGSGPADWNTMLNRPFYEEVTETESPINIQWDGNTDGLVSAAGVAFKVSGLVFSDEVAKTCTMTDSNGETVPLADVWDDFTGNGETLLGDLSMIGPVFICRTAGAEFDGAVFPETGIYFMLEDGQYATSLTSDELVVQRTEVLKKLDPKYLPDTVATKDDLEAARSYVILNSSTEGSTKQFKITVDDSGTLSATEVTS